MHKLLIASVIVATPAVVGFGSPVMAQAAATPAAAGFSVETTDLGTLLADPPAKAILVKHLPALVGNDQIQMASSLTLKQLQGYAADAVTDEKLAAIQADLNKLPKK